MKRDFILEKDGKKYTIKNVPYEEYEAEGEEFVDAGVAVKLEMILVLMYDSKIPDEVDFEEIKDLEF